MTAPARAGSNHTTRAVVVFVLVLTVAAVAVAAAAAGLPAAGGVPWTVLPVLAVLLVAATWLLVPFRYGDSVDAGNLVEAAIAPLLIAFAPLHVIVVVALSQVANGLLRRLAPIKVAFNTAMWALAAGLGGLVMAPLHAAPLWPDRVLGLVAALAVVGVVNALAFGTVLTLAEGEPLRRLARRLVPVIDLGWLAAWAVNAAFGLLFALALVATPVAVAVFGVPLIVLHLAYRSYSAARADQARLAATHRAAARLAEPLQPLTAIPAFLRDLVDCFDAGAAEVVLRTPEGRQIHRVDRGGAHMVRTDAEDTACLEGLLAAMSGPVRLEAGQDHPVARALHEAGASDCLGSPLLDGDRVLGAVLVLDRGGFEGSAAADLAIVEALAQQITAAIVKGRLLDDVLQERHKLAQIVTRASDGICSFGPDGTVVTWNPAMEAITGLRARDVIGRRVPAALGLRSASGRPVDLQDWPASRPPTQLRITAADGTSRRLTCSYSTGSNGGGDAALIVVARDVTPAAEQAALRRQVSELLEADEARRAIVDQLQQAVVPGPVEISGAELAASYEASDPSAPTGGDLYDWQVLPSGEVHIAVVDVLGHGVAATKDALAVVHTLRVVTADGTPLGEVVARADELLGAQHPGLVATVIVARYDPATGCLQVASGGHPPALLVSAQGTVTQVAASGGVIGWPGAGSDDVSETTLGPGDALILYTDGLIEARKNILDGMDTLVEHAAQVAHLPAAPLAEELVRRALAGADRRDDTLALVLRRDPLGARAQHVTWTFAPDAVEASATRRALHAWLERRGLQAHDAVLVAGELLANAARAARGRVTLTAALDRGSIILEVSDDGGRPDAGSSAATDVGTSLPGADADGGRGLFIVRQLCDEVDVRQTPQGWHVRGVVPLGATRRQQGLVKDRLQTT
jgi:PAS domain S-box-containing protein